MADQYSGNMIVDLLHKVDGVKVHNIGREVPIIEDNIGQAMQCIVNEMFKNGEEEGLKIWNDATHPLRQAIQHLLSAKWAQLAGTPEGLRLVEMLKNGEPPASFFQT